jgi:23S rRNA (guanosine2251-2'-O)-methyltransferase
LISKDNRLRLPAGLDLPFYGEVSSRSQCAFIGGLQTLRPRGNRKSMAQKSWQPKLRPRRPRDKRSVASRGRFRASAGYAPDGPAVLYGWHTVKAALENPTRRIRRLMTTENAARRLADDGVPLPIEPELVRPDVIEARLGPDAVHQGLLAEADPLPALTIDELTSEGIVLVLDQITDPHNVGAILRSAAAFAVGAIVTTARHSPEATGVLAKSASGALEIVRLVTLQNLARGMEELRERGFLLVGLEGAGETDLADLTLRAPLALVLGAEGKGLRQLTRATCDHLARINLPGAIKSLNVSNAAALALYVASRRLSG